MIKISLDEASAFDMLSILNLKLKSDEGLVNYNNMSKEIINSIGVTMYNDIRFSDEYTALYDANKKVFELVDQMNAGSDLSAIFVHKCNMQRYTAKKNLQHKFFSNSLTERKI